MWIDQLSIRGFRGFNDQQTLAFHPRLTVIYAPNSYGKTSISEAIEWLLYGTTSKLDHADYKEEYRGSLRNLHLLETLLPEVEVVFHEGETKIVYHSELANEESIHRMVDGKPTEFWPLQTEIDRAVRPFILQHTLKELLLAKPNERFEGIARLLGFHALHQIQEDVVSFCTKPEAHIPPRVQELRHSVSEIETRLQSQPSLSRIGKAYRKGYLNWTTTSSLINEEARKHIPSDTTDNELLPLLQMQREEAVGRIFSGRLYLPAYSEAERTQLQTEGQYFLGYLTSEFVASYAQLIGLVTNKALNERIQFFHLGIQILNVLPETCPLCGQQVVSDHHLAIHNIHAQLQIQQKADQALNLQLAEVAREVRTLRTRLEQDQSRHTERLAPLIAIATQTGHLEDLAKILGKAHVSVVAVRKAVVDIVEVRDRLWAAFSNAMVALDSVEASLHGKQRIEEALMLALGEILITYVATVKDVIQVVNKHAGPVSLADQALRHELDKRAGTEDISILIDLLNHCDAIAKKLEIDAVLAGLKDFRKSVDKFVSTEMEDAVAQAFTADVFTWYSKIRTNTDPDVHFEGFDFERTVKGETRPRRVSINATSYGKKLASAVSSLSESKLNALGICISIAMNMRHMQRFGFLVIDDPIQSLDAEHEAQFVEVIRDLVEQGKQVILLSHNKRWVDAVRNGCRSINGWMYEITGYNQSGPHISEKPWAVVQERFNEIDAILNDQAADNVRLQHAEEEIRILACELTAQMMKQVHGKNTSPHTLNASRVRSLLITCSVDQRLVDRVGQTFSTTDDAHHAPSDYTPHRPRIQQYSTYLKELYQVLKNAKSGATSTLSPSSKISAIRRAPLPADVLESLSSKTETMNTSITPLANGD
jgi:AAA domain